MRENGNDYLLDLFESNEKKLLGFIFKSSFFLSEQKVKLYEVENISIRIAKNNKNTTFYKYEKGEYKKIVNGKNIKQTLKKHSKENTLFKKNGNDYKEVKIDSSGNYSPQKFLKEKMNIILTRKNYRISHLEKKPNTDLKHGFKNIMIIPNFLDHFINSNIFLDNKNVNNISKLISTKIYKLDDSFFNDFIPTDEEKKYAKNIFKYIKTLN